MIQDTSFVIDVLNGDDDALALLDVFERENRPEKISGITLLELYEGVGRADKPADEKQRVLGVLDSKHVVDADASIMRHAGELSAELYDSGQPIDREDCIVAATALREDELVVTRNARHFERVPDLDARTY